MFKKTEIRDGQFDGFVILNPWGDIWSRTYFYTKESAQEHLKKFFPHETPRSLKRFKIVEARWDVKPLLKK